MGKGWWLQHDLDFKPDATNTKHFVMQTVSGLHICPDSTRFVMWSFNVIHMLALAGLMKDGFTVLRKVFDAKECSLDPFRL